MPRLASLVQNLHGRSQVPASAAAGLMVLLGIGGCALLRLGASPTIIYVSDLDLSAVAQDRGTPRRDRSVNGNELRMASRAFARGLGTHAGSRARILLHGRALRFRAQVGVDDEVLTRDGRRRGSVEFLVFVDGRKAYQSGVMHASDPPRTVEVDVRGAGELWLVVDPGQDGIRDDHADWGEARLEVKAGAPLPALLEPERAPTVVLTPKPPAQPRLNGPAVYGAGAGRPFLYRIPATGERPLEFDAVGLPAGLSLDRRTGIITGVVYDRGTFEVMLQARNRQGAAEKRFRIIIGKGLALTPPLGWNSRNVRGCAVDDAKIRRAADALVATGLADHGWAYVNIDDCWMRRPGPDARDPNTGEILPNEKFPDMRALTDYVHARGLKLGIYTGPNESTCQGFVASKGYERADLRAFARWGVDYIKVDWCSANRDPVAQQQAYRWFGDLLKEVERDIVYSLCQYGWHRVWEWGAGVGGNLWCTAGEIEDTWGSMATTGFQQDEMAPFAAPGHWNDPDRLVVGLLGRDSEVRPSRLTPDEQYTHLSLWALLAAPLLIGADLTQLDEFTLGLLTNDEVLAVNQDERGIQGKRVARLEGGDVYAKPLADGSFAVGLFNRDWFEHELGVDWEQLGLSGPQRVRDLWRQQDLGVFDRGYAARVPSHGVVLVSVAAAGEQD